MKLVKKRKDGSTATLKTSDKKVQSATDNTQKTALPPWKILIVDDENDVHIMTKLSLKGFEFEGRPLEIFQAMS